MRFFELLARCGLPQSENDFEVTSLVTDHRHVEVNSVFIAVSGTKHDGHNFVSTAMQAGAGGVVCERDCGVKNSVIVPNSRNLLGQLAAAFFDYPGSRHRLVGVTGTNGKTSVTLMLEKIMKDAGRLTGVMGTIDHHCGEKKWSSDLTTPDAITLHKRLKDFRDCGAEVAVMEVSSHALSQGRADSLKFNVAVFTNLSRDHLDYHSSFEDYFASKNRLFSELLFSEQAKAVAVLNADDKWSRKIQTPKSAKRITYGQAGADLVFQMTESSFSGTNFKLQFEGQAYESSLRLVGMHSIYNAMAAVLAAHALGVEVAVALDSLKDFTSIPGRLQPVANTKGVQVFVDYAHTDDALKSILQALAGVREKNDSLKGAQIHLVFGCGGDRDKGKRPIMGKVADQFADWIYVTSDNPRTENPNSILDDIAKGIQRPKGQRLFRIENRRDAIEEALKNAKKGDVVLIAGKGHEDYQIIGTKKFHFSDVEVVAEILNGL